MQVYGVGFYVSKRDILADSSFEPYASLSSEGLRGSPDFFLILRTMKGFTNANQPAGNFDRTIFLKTNMHMMNTTFIHVNFQYMLSGNFRCTICKLAVLQQQ